MQRFLAPGLTDKRLHAADDVPEGFLAVIAEYVIQFHHGTAYLASGGTERNAWLLTRRTPRVATFGALGTAGATWAKRGAVVAAFAAFRLPPEDKPAVAA